MADSKRLPIPTDNAVDRDSQIDALLEEGLDRYFNNRYEDAIHLWTRVLFLDRNHPRARAYVDRARTALAEGHRRSEELLHASRDLIDQGRTDDARELLTEAIARGGDDLQSAALRVQLERRERARVVGPATGPAQPVEAVPGWSWTAPRLSPMTIAGIAALTLVVIIAAAGVLDLGDADSSAPPSVPGVTATLPIPSSSSVALVRAQALYARGRLAEALQRLDSVSPGSPERLRADQLRIEIQQQLLASARSTSGTASMEAPRR